MQIYCSFFYIFFKYFVIVLYYKQLADKCIFVIFLGCEIPGCSRSFDPDGIVCQTTHFPAGGEYVVACEPGSMEMHGNRGIDLGCNM